MTELEFIDFEEISKYHREANILELLGTERKNRTLLLATNTNNYTIHIYEEDGNLVLLQYEGKTILKRSLEISQENIVTEADLFYIVRTTQEPQKFAQIRTVYPESCDYKFCLQVRKYFPKFFEQMDFANYNEKAFNDNIFKGKIAALETITVQVLK